MFLKKKKNKAQANADDPAVKYGTYIHLNKKSGSIKDLKADPAKIIKRRGADSDFVYYED